MDIDFLASGGMLERGTLLPDGQLPSVPAMLAAGLAGARLDELLGDYAFLRRLEARTRWVIGRAVEHVDLRADSAPAIAELCAPGSTPDRLARAVAGVRVRVRAAFDAVIRAGSLSALGD
jgi:hypothetical protein